MLKKHAVWFFFLATFVVSWLIWVPAIVLAGDGPNLALVGLGAFSPSPMGIVSTYLTQDRQGRRDFWRRVIDVRRIRLPWLAVILLASPLTIVVAALLYTLLGGALPAMTETVQRFGSPARLAELLIAGLLFGAVSEELGWRGYAAAILLHFVGNLSLDLAAGLQGAMSQGSNLAHTCLYALLAIGVIAKRGPRTLTGRQVPASARTSTVTA